MSLKLDVSGLDNIEDKCRGDNNKALRLMLQLWFNTDESPTWKKLCRSLCSTTVARNALAGEIRKFVSEQGEIVYFKIKSNISICYTYIGTPSKAPAGPSRTGGRSGGAAVSEKTITGRGRKRTSDGAGAPASSPKRTKKPMVKPGKVEGDRVLRKLSQELGDKWMDVGIELGLKYDDLKNTIEDDPKIPHKRKPMDMLQTWKKSAGDDFTYQTLATALENVGLNTCAQTHCYQ